MLSIKYKVEGFDITKATDLCSEVGQSLGINLMKRKANNTIHGHFQTNSEGEISINIYRDEEIQKFNVPGVNFENCGISDTELINKCNQFAASRGWTKAE